MVKKFAKKYPTLLFLAPPDGRSAGSTYTTHNIDPTLPLSCSATENLVCSWRTARTPIPSLQYTCTGGRCWGNDRPKWGTLAFAVSRGRAKNSRTMARHVYSYSQSASCLSGGSLPDPWGERQWAAGDSRDKGDAWSLRQGGKGREKVKLVPSLNTHHV